MQKTLFLGDCLDRMREMPSDSVDAIVTDPPYALTGTSGTGGFMGAKWDSELPSVEIWREALRIAKPGAHLLAFGGSRTYHRLACAIEDAGWEIRDCIMWVYGCLSEDTEILTCKGWAKIGTIQVGDRIHAYDRATKTFRYEEVKDTFLYDYDDTAYRIQSDSTDQLVSRNHRVIVERGGVEVFEYAENLAQEHEIRVPVLEGLQDLLNNIPNLQSDASQQKSLLLQKMPAKRSEENRKAELCMRCMRKIFPCLTKPQEEKRGCDLLSPLQWNIARKGTDEVLQEPPAQEDAGGNSISAPTDDGEQEPCMERRSDIPPSSRKLCEREVCIVPEGISDDGPQGRICNGASSNCGANDWKTAETNGSRASCKSQSAGQQQRESDVILDEPNAQIIRGAWKTTTTLARITPVQYKGRMWCVSVPSGAIVARRNGKIFVTGNSGFPKGMDVSKAIDKAHNATHDRALKFTRWLKSTGVTAAQVNSATNSKMARRWLCEDDAAGIPTPEMFALLRPLLPEVPQEIERLVAERALDPNSDYAKRKVLSSKENGRTLDGVLKNGFSSKEIKDTEPYSAEAQRWQGWNTQLKPAYEPIVLARKPLDGTIVRNVLAYGTGALNIDACRVGTEKMKNPPASNNRSPSAKGVVDFRMKASVAPTEAIGRWPANIIHDGSPEVLSCFPDAKGQCGAIKGSEPSKSTVHGIYGAYDARSLMMPRKDLGSAARFFYCAKASRAERGEGNDHSTVKPLTLMEYLVRLVTRKGGTVLDPFMGSGTTGIACAHEGMSFVGIEKDEHYFEIAKRRLAETESQPRQTELF